MTTHIPSGQTEDQVTGQPILRGWLWRLLGWIVVVVVLASIGYAVIVLLATLLESGAL